MTRRVGVFGGTFDPIHLGHLVVAEEVTGRLGLEVTLFVPAGQPWFKDGSPVTDAGHRLNMARLAVRSNPRFRVCDLEVRRPGPSYTVDTLEHLRRAMPDAEFFVVLGQDALAEIHRWRCPGRVFELATVVGVTRPGAADLDACALDGIFPSAARRVIMLDVPQVDVTATELRRRAAAGRSLRYLAPDSVAAYIREHGLYK